jgi:hypothetical protein
MLWPHTKIPTSLDCFQQTSTAALWPNGVPFTEYTNIFSIIAIPFNPSLLRFCQAKRRGTRNISFAEPRINHSILIDA